MKKKKVMGKGGKRKKTKNIEKSKKLRNNQIQSDSKKMKS
jgi:hypothetical protein